ncbi:MAG TPA: phage tail protein [Maritimibacter sp.]|nr:phage tail protein [Maritimibacter sp.]
MSDVKLNKRLTLEAPVRNPDGAGGFETTWVVLGQLWANVKPGSGRERAVETMTASVTRLTITVRAAPVGSTMRPQPGQRMRAGTRVFKILAVSEADVAARYLRCLAEEEVAA